MHQGAFGAFFLHVAFFTTPMMYLSDHASSDRTLTEEFSLCAMCRSCISAVKLSMQGTAFRHLDIIFSKGRNAKLLKRTFSTVFATAAEGTSGFSSGLGASRINRPKSLKRSRISTQLSHWALRPFSSLKTTVFPAAAICQKLQLQNAKAAKQQLQNNSCKPKAANPHAAKPTHNMSCGRIAAKLEPCQTLCFLMSNMSGGQLPNTAVVQVNPHRWSRKRYFKSIHVQKQILAQLFSSVGIPTRAQERKKNKLFQHSCSYALDGI